MSYLKTPQLPEGRVTRVAIGEKYRARLEQPLQKLGVRCEWLPDYKGIDERLAGHADLLLLHIGKDRFAVAEGLDIPLNIPTYNKVPVGICDAALNSCAVGDHWLCCKKTAAIVPADKIIISIKQRYTRCSVCVVDEQSIITADRGIAKAVAEQTNLNCLLIETGHIHLDGFDYGFIGGASFKLAKDVLAFTGTLDSHPNQKKILKFLDERGIRPIYLTNDPIFDIGSAVLLDEETS